MVVSLCLFVGIAVFPISEPVPVPVAQPAPHYSATPYGYHWQPAYSIDKQPRAPLESYNPQPGDIFLYSDTNALWTLLYLIARSLPVPGHSGIIVRMEDGKMGILEAGYDDKPVTKITPLDKRLAEYTGTIWIRKRRTPLTEQQSALLSQFAYTIQDRKYPIIRFAGQLTLLRSRGPIRTIFLGKPKGTEGRYLCAEAVMEAIVYAGLVPAETARPAATYPRDIFFDRSPIPYINKHLNLYCAGWEVPVLWTNGSCEKKPVKLFGLR